MTPRVVLVLLLVAAHALVAQEVSPQEETSSANKTAISFSFNGLYLRGLEGGIGLKSWVSARSALVASLEAHHKSRDEEYEESGDRSTTTTSMGLSIEFHRHVSAGNKLSPYAGFGLGTGIRHRRNSHTYPEESGLDRYEITADEYYISGNILFGIEYFIADEISLSGQHSFEALYCFGSEELEQGDQHNKADLSGLSLGLGTSGLVLSIYL
jgi:hypothetical protein